MANTNMNIRMDSDVKAAAEALFSEFGLNMTTAINMFLRQSIREQRIPFELKLELPNAETIKAIEEADALMSDPNTKRYQSTEELFDELDRP